jgi:hypothetical protein
VRPPSQINDLAAPVPRRTRAGLLVILQSCSRFELQHRGLGELNVAAETRFFPDSVDQQNPEQEAGSRTRCVLCDSTSSAMQLPNTGLFFSDVETKRSGRRSFRRRF